MWARLVAAHRQGRHTHSRQDTHGLPGSYRSELRAQLPRQLTNGHHLMDTKDGKTACWVKSSVLGLKAFIISPERSKCEFL